jgi:hypothetical protein
VQQLWHLPFPSAARPQTAHEKTLEASACQGSENSREANRLPFNERRYATLQYDSSASAAADTRIAFICASCCVIALRK